MTYSTQWLRLCESKVAYGVRQYKFMQDEAQMARDLQQALAGVEDNLTALQLLVDLKPDVEILMPLLAQVLDSALDCTGIDRIVYAREVLAIHKDDPEVRNHIRTLVTNYLDADEWHYWRIAELYTRLNYREEMAPFLALCRASDNPEIQEIADDFSGS